MKKQRGSITIFSTIAIMLISAFVFTMLEGARYQQLTRLFDLQTELAKDAALSNYNNSLWETYHLLGADISSAQEIIYKTINAKSDGEGMNLLVFKGEDVTIESYTLLTDGNGTAFVNSVSAYMKNNLLYETIKEIYSQYESIRELINSNEMEVSNIAEALKNIETMDKPDNSSTGTSGMQRNGDEKKAVSILETAKRWLELGVLELVVEDTKTLSKAETDFQNGVLERELKTGKNAVLQPVTWEDEILLQQYLRTYLSHYRDTKTGRALEYEVEYLIGKQDSDAKNLENVVTKLLLVREAANFLHLVSNPEKSAKAEGMAALIAGVSLNPVVLKAVKMGLLTAWALAESILDVRALLEGKRIAFIKSDETWTTSLENIEEISNSFVMAKASPWGLSYEDYLGVFLLLEDEENMAMRSLEIQEACIQRIEGDTSFRIDELFTQIEVNVEYSHSPVFPFSEILGGT